MIDRALEWLIDLARTRTRWAIAMAGVGVLLSAYAATVPLDFSFSGVMNRDHPEVARYFAASADYGLGGALLILVEGPEEELDQAVKTLRETLRGLPEVRAVDEAFDEDVLRAGAAWWIDRADFDEWVALAQGDLDAQVTRESIRAVRDRIAGPEPGSGFGSGSGSGSVSDGARLVRIAMTRDTFEMALDADDFPTIRSATAEALAPYAARARFAGMPAIVTQEQEATIERMVLLGPLSLLIVLLILASAERRWMILLSIAVPMLLAAGGTLGLIGLVYGKLTIMESLFGVLVFGLGIDFAIHLLLRLREEQGRGLSFDESLTRAFHGTGRGVVAGAATSAGAFFILSFAPDPVFYRLGLSGGLGLSLCLLFLMVMLPAQWAWVERMAPTPADRSPAPPRRLWIEGIARFSSNKPVLVLVVAGMLFALGGVQTRELRFETNLERVFSRDIDAVQTRKRIEELYGAHSGAWLVPTNSLEEARAVGLAFEADPLFATTESVAKLIPEDLEERRAVLEGLAQEFASIPLAASSPLQAEPTSDGGIDGDGDDALPAAALLLAAHRAGPPRTETLPAAIRDRLIGPRGEYLVLAYPREPSLDSAVAARERRAAQAIHPQATSMSAIYEALIGTDRPWLGPIVGAVFLFIGLVVRLDLGSVRHALLALVPAGFSFVISLGLLATFGLQPNTVTLVAFPLMLGLTVDDGIHVVHRMLEEPGAPIDRVVGSVARSIALTTATTCGSVVLLLFSRHPGIESIATVLLLGLPLALLSTLTIMPALVAVARRDRLD